MNAHDPPVFSVNIVAPFPTVFVAKALTPSAALFATGKATVIHFYNNG
jgi:hypothetical protein